MNDSRPSRGERIEDVTQNAVRLAHRVVDRFPHVKRRHMVVAGGAALSSAIIAAAAVAVAAPRAFHHAAREVIAATAVVDLPARPKTRTIQLFSLPAIRHFNIQFVSAI